MKLRILALVIVALIAVYFLSRPTIETEIATRLDNLMLLSVRSKPYESIEARFLASDFGASFAESVDVDYDSPDYSVSRTVSKKELVDGLTAGLLNLESSNAKYSRLVVKQENQNVVVVSLVLVAEWKMRGDAEPFIAAEDCRIVFTKEKREWKISSIKTLRR